MGATAMSCPRDFTVSNLQALILILPPAPQGSWGLDGGLKYVYHSRLNAKFSTYKSTYKSLH